MKKAISLVVILLFLTQPLLAAEVKNLTSGQSGNKGYVQYDLLGKLGEKEAEVTVFLEINGERYGAEKLSLSGDYGKKVKIGKGKRFQWDFLKDFPAGFEGEVTWDVEAVGAKQVSSASPAVGDNPGKGEAGKSLASPLRDPTTGMEFVRVPAGCFQMGDTFGDGDKDEKPVHEVCVDGFSMGKYEVKIGEFRKFVNDTGYRTDAEKGDGCYTVDSGGNWSKKASANWKNPGFNQNDDHPVVCVSHNDASEFSRWLSRTGGRNYRLPTEAEWEYAARGGTTTRNYWGNSKDYACSYANVADRTAKGQFSGWSTHDCDDGYLYTAPAGSFKPNGFDLYDMMGNAWEWVNDWYSDSYYASSPRNNPQGASNGQYRVVRGGSWDNEPGGVRASNRLRSRPDFRGSYYGFRLVLPQD